MCSPARSVTGNQRRDKSGFMSKVSWLSLEAQQLCHLCGRSDMAWVARLLVQQCDPHPLAPCCDCCFRKRMLQKEKLMQK